MSERRPPGDHAGGSRPARRRSGWRPPQSARQPGGSAPAGLQQHDLRPQVAQDLIDRAGIDAEDAVVEVGPGLGALTAALLQRGATVQAVELDPARIAHLNQRFAAEIAAGRLILSAGDARQWRPHLTEGWRAVANPPFALTSELVRRWLLADPPPFALDLVLQRDAALKLTGSDTEQTRSSALLRSVGTPTVALTLPRNATLPPAHVDLCWWSYRRTLAVPPADLAATDALLAHAFAGPHSLRAALRGLATGEQLRRHAREFAYDPDGPARAVPAMAWAPLALLLKHCGKLRLPAR